MTDSHELGPLLAQAQQELAAAGIESARTETHILAAHIAKIPRGELQAALITGRQIPFDVDAFEDLVHERTRRVPLQHLTGTAPFRSLELAVGPGVFIPRPETESVAQCAIDELQNMRDTWTRDEAIIAVDLCTGSGAIALALATESCADEVHGVEVSELAFAWAQQNQYLLTTKYGPTKMAELHMHHGDATAPETLSELNGRVAVVVTNPPYIPPHHVPVDAEVRDHDPEIALYGRGEDGLKVPRAVLNRAQNLLIPGGTIIMEHAEVQAEALRRIAIETGWQNVETRSDLNQRPRMLYATCASSQTVMGE